MVAHAGDHGFDMRQQIRMQLGVVQQVVVIVAVDVVQNVIHQRFVVVGVNRTRGDLLNLTRGDVDAEPVFLRRGEYFVGKVRNGKVRNGNGDITRGIAYILFHIFGVKFRQRIAFADTPHRHGAIQTDKQLAFIRETNVMARKGVVQHHHQLLRHARIEGDFRHQRIEAVLLRQFPQQIGQAGANRHLTAEQFHAVARARFQGQRITLEPLSHFCHVTL
ncbi:hypothetical protein D3C72_1418480 [compost metagenome]